MAQGKACLFAAAGLLLAGVAGCAYPISKEWREQARKDLAFTRVQQDATPYVGAIVIWGGVIIRTENAQNATDIIVLETPLDSMGAPGAPESSQGRFIARGSTFMDPAIFAPRRKVTVAGEIVEKVTQPIGSVNYTYPVIAIKQIYLWPIPTIRYYEPPGYYPEDWDWDGPFLFHRDFGGGHEHGRPPGR